jgi:hypothetical protein
MSIERKATSALPTRSRSWENLVPHIDLGRGVRARHIQLDMERAPTFDLYAKAGKVLEAMQANRWDNVPVTSKGRVVGYVKRTQLMRTEADQPIRNVTHSLAGGSIVSGDTPISDLMEWIAKQRIVFVLEGREVTGIVTIWDFNKQPARAYYYLVLAGLEIALADLVRWRYGKNQSNLIAHLGSRDTEDLNERMSRDRAGSGHGDLVSYLNFKHLLRVFEKDRALRSELGKYDPAKWTSMTKPLGELRNEVMHPVTTLVGSVEDMEALTRDIKNAIKLVEHAIVALRKKYPVKPK